MKAANRGQMNAQYVLGLCYEDGTGVQKSNAEAQAWYRKAAAQGHEEAQEALRKNKVQKKYFTKKDALYGDKPTWAQEKARKRWEMEGYGLLKYNFKQQNNQKYNGKSTYRSAYDVNRHNIPMYYE